MIAIVVAAVTIIASFGAAWFGARLRRKWTPNPIPPIENLGSRVEELRQRIEAIEQERMDAANFTLGIRLTEGHTNYYLLLATNDNDRDVSIGTMQLFLGEAPLCGPEKLKPIDNWLIPARSRKQLKWSPESDPIMTLKSAGVGPAFCGPLSHCVGLSVRRKTKNGAKDSASHVPRQPADAIRAVAWPSILAAQRHKFPEEVRLMSPP